MDKAVLIYNEGKRPEKTVDAGHVERWVRRRPEILDEVSFVSPEKRQPVFFRPTIYQGGFYHRISAHFSREAGAVNAPHVITKTKKPSLQAQIDNPEINIVLNLNLNLSHRLVVLERDSPTLGENYDAWREQHKNKYEPVSIGSAQQLSGVVKKIFASAASKDRKPEQRIFASYRGAVMPYEQFYVGRNENAYPDLFFNLYFQHGGVLLREKKSGGSATPQNRVVGFPRLLVWNPSETFRSAEPKATFHSKAAECPSRHAVALNLLVFPRHDDKADTPEFAALKEAARDPLRRLFVLASPTITWDAEIDPRKYDREKRPALEHIRWTVGSIKKQTFTLPVPQPAVA